MQRVEERHQRLPRARLDRLPAVVAEAEVHRLRHRHGVQHSVDCRRRQRTVRRVARDVGLVYLHAGRSRSRTCAAGASAIASVSVPVAIVLVEQRARQHVRAGERT